MPNARKRKSSHVILLGISIFFGAIVIILAGILGFENSGIRNLDFSSISDQSYENNMNTNENRNKQSSEPPSRNQIIIGESINDNQDSQTNSQNQNTNVNDAISGELVIQNTESQVDSEENIFVEPSTKTGERPTGFKTTSSHHSSTNDDDSTSDNTNSIDVNSPKNQCSDLVVYSGQPASCESECCNIIFKPYAVAGGSDTKTPKSDNTNHSVNTNNTTANTSTSQNQTAKICSGDSSNPCKIENGKGIQYRTCNNGEWTGFGTCHLQSCNFGFLEIENKCVNVSNSVSCAGSNNISCEIPNGEGIKYRTCNNGAWSNYGVCTSIICRDGFTYNGAGCFNMTPPVIPPVIKTCTGINNQTCFISNGSGIQYRTCNNGTWTDYGTCTLTSCNTGYKQEGNTCIQKMCIGPSSQSCVLENGKGMHSRTCINGEWSDYGECSIDSCDAGYFLISGKCVQNNPVPEPRSSTGAIIADHNAARDFNIIPKCWLDEARNEISIAYQHSSHGSQIPSGMDYLKKQVSSSLYSYSDSDTAGSLYFKDLAINGAGGYSAPDLGYASWDEATKAYLQSHADINTIMWSWCGQVVSFTSTSAMYEHYLYPAEDLMENNNINFIFMTGHLDGSGPTGSVYKANNIIRNYVKENQGILFDFADIESYDPSGKYYPSESDACSWCTSWCNTHPNDCKNLPTCAHSHGFNCVQKAKAFWWMMARISGWDGTAGDSCP